MKFKACKYLIQDVITGSREVEGYAVDGLPYQIGIHRDSYGCWVASDWVTGMRVGFTSLNSKPACVAEAVRNMDAHGGPKAIKKSQDGIIKQGLFKTYYTGART